MNAYVELHCHSNFSFLDGASHPWELARRAADLEMPALALEDRVGSTLDGMARSETPIEGIAPTTQLKDAVEAAFHRVGYPAQVGTRQLVLGLAAGEGIASGALATLGVTEPALRAELDRIGADADPEA